MEPIQITSAQNKQAHKTTEEYAIGIDFGTTHSVVAFSNNKNVEILADQNNIKLIPSIVTLTKDSIIVGKHKDYHSNNQDSALIPSIKRLIGKGTDDLTEEYNYLEDIIDRKKSSKESIVMSFGQHQNLSPAMISAKILTLIKSIAEKNLNKTITKAVITVPAQFNEHQRNTIKYAATLANLEVLRIINEPTSAALAYGLDKNTEGNYIIYDLGGGTFDVSILQMNKGVFKVIATNGDPNLGGDDIDHLLSKYIKKQIQPKLSEHQILKKARHIKEALSKKTVITTTIDNKPFTLDRKDFNKLITNLIKKTINTTLNTLDESNLEDEIDGIILVGGSSRIPLIREELKQHFNNIKIYDDINPDEVVAKGAALQAESLTRGSSHLLLDINPLSLGIALADGMNERIIERNTTVPISITKTYTTYKDNQTGLILNIIQGERELAKDCRKLGTLELKNIPPMKAGAPRIKVTFTLDADNLLTVSAEEETTATKQHIELLPSYKLDMHTIENMLYDSIRHAQDDIKKKSLITTIFKAESTLEQLQNSIQEDINLLTPQELKDIKKQCTVVKQAIKNKNLEKINLSLEGLEKSMLEFNSKKINKYINIGLKGANIKQIKNTNE